MLYFDTKVIEVLDLYPTDIETIINKCPNPVQNPNPIVVDGCTGVPNNPVANSYQAVIDTSFGSTSANDNLACNLHDKCYGTCGSDRGDCDASFHTRLQNVCYEAYPGNTGDSFIDEQHNEGLLNCLIWSNQYGSTVELIGQSFWDDGQKEGCQCCAN